MIRQYHEYKLHRWLILQSAFFAIAVLPPTLPADEPAATEHPVPAVVVPGWQRFHAEDLTPVQSGRLLISELNCQSCHGELPGILAASRQAPILTAAASRINPEHIRSYLKSPQNTKPGTAMPKIGSVSGEDQAIDALTAFLTAGSQWRAQAVAADSARRGEALFHTIGCAACHGDQRSDQTIDAIRRGLVAAAPDKGLDEEDEEKSSEPVADLPARPDYVMPLGHPESKYNVASLAAFLQQPHQVRPSGRMPSLNLNPNEARDIASYLLRDVDVKANIEFEYFEGSWDKLPDFSQLQAKSSGTTTDFTVSAAARNEAFALRFTGYLQIAVAGEYQFHIRSDDGSRIVVDEKPVAVNDGIHPATTASGKIALAAGSHTVVVEYFEQGGQEVLEVQFEGPETPRQPLSAAITLTREPPPADDQESAPAATPELVQQGRELFASVGCASCHQYGDGDQRIQSTLQAPTFAAATPGEGCLGETVPRHLPEFRLSEQQRSDITAAIAAARGNAEPGNELKQSLLALNCYGCHVRGGWGGNNEAVNHLFTGTIPEMGDEGRLPPGLDGAGDKLNDNWLRTIFREGANDRPYVNTRMPRFGDQLADSLAPLLAAADRSETAGPEVRFDQPNHRVIADARMLIGDKALSCIKCHRFGSYAATGLQSMDMTTMTRRLRREWFHRYLIDPQKYRPGTRMPAAWPGGKAIFPDVLGGKAETQIEAIWAYLLDGTRAKMPSGLEKQTIEIVPTDRPLIYRNFIEGLSPRGIAVGFPEKAHYAWDAEQMTLRLIWHGAFIDASKHWVNRGPGRQVPMGDHVMSLPAGPPLAALDSLDEAWPSGNPRETGFQFLGYRLNSAGVPTFRYRWQQAFISETITPVPAEPDAGLTREFQIRSDTALKSVWLRVAAGEISETDTGFLWNGVQIQVEAGLASVRRSGTTDELLIQLPDGVQEASVRLHMMW